MNDYLKILSAPLLSVLLVGCASTSAYNNDYSQQQKQTPYAQQQRQPKAGPMESITGKVTEAGGLIAENGTPYRLNGAKAADLRNYANQTVTVNGYRTEYKGNRALIVESFQAEQQPSNVSQSQTGSQNNQQASGSDQQAGRDTDKSNQQANPDMNSSDQQANPDQGQSASPSN